MEWKVPIYNILICGRNQVFLLSNVISKSFYPKAERLWNKAETVMQVQTQNRKYSHCVLVWFWGISMNFFRHVPLKN